MIAASICSFILATLLLFMPVSMLLWLPFSHGSTESALVLMYAVLAPVAMVLAWLAWRFSWLQPKWRDVGLFLILGVVIIALDLAAFFALAYIFQVSDSSHGGTLLGYVMGAVGILAASLGWLLWEAYRNQGVKN
jgi:hypothetical protein